MSQNICHLGYSKSEISVSIPLFCHIVKAETVYWSLRGIPELERIFELFKNQ